MSNEDLPIRKLECFEFDSRLIDRHIAEDRITSKKYDKYLSKLEDLADDHTVFTVTLGEGSPTGANR
jgi:hypothetical protein